MFSIKKAILFGVTALTTVAMNGIFNVNSAQAAVSNHSQSTLNSINFNTEVDTENSPLTLLPIKRTQLISLKRGMVICKPNSVSSCQKTNNNQPDSTNKPAREITNNHNQSNLGKNSSTIRRSIRKMQKIQN